MIDYAQPSLLDLLEHCAENSALSEGDASTLFLSYAREDHEYVSLLRKSLDPALDLLNTRGIGLSIWEYGDRDAGTQPGDIFPTTIAENMWRCRAAIVFWSRDYVRSPFCHAIELPFLLWRMKHSGLKFFLVRINSTVVDNEPIPFPSFLGVSGSINLLHIVDDRNPNLMPLSDSSSELMLERLLRSDPGAANERIVRYVESICKKLLRDFSGADAFEADQQLRNAKPPASSIDEDQAPVPNRWPRGTVWRVAIAAAVVSALFVTAATYFRPIWNRLTGQDAATSGCDAAALSPDDPLARKGRGGVKRGELDERGIDPCRKAAELLWTDNGRYEFQLGRLLEKDKRYGEAIVAYGDAADKGYRLAANNLGALYSKSPELFFDRVDKYHCATKAACDDDALTWFAKANDGTNAAAIFNMATIYHTQPAVRNRRDDLACKSDADCDRRARDLLIHAAELGEPEASGRLGWLYLSWYGRIDKESPETLAAAPCSSREACGGKAASALRVPAEQGDSRAQFALGRLYENQSGLLGAPPPDGCATASDCVDDAILWYGKAAPASPEAAARLASLKDAAAKP